MDTSERLNNVIYRGFDDLELNKNIQDSLVGYDRNRTPAVKNTRENSLEFVTKYNNQRKVNEIMACLYEGQRMQTDHLIPRSPNCVMLFERNAHLINHSEKLYSYAKRLLMITDLQLYPKF